jgi:hypothetical protein
VTRFLLISFAAALSMAEVSAAQAGSAGRCGGTGGEHSRTLTCPSGQYIAGIGARGAALVDEFSIACRKIPTSGAPGDLGGFSTAGPGGGTGSASDTCDKNHAVIAMFFKSGIYLDRARGGICGKRSGTGWGSQTQSKVDMEVGGIGGENCSLNCPEGEAMYEVTVKFGAWVDSVRGSCRR